MLVHGYLFYDFNDDMLVSSISRKERKRTTPKCHCILTAYFLEKPLLLSAFQKRLCRNENQEIKFSGQHIHTRSTNEKILQWRNTSALSVGSSLYSFMLPLNTTGLPLESACPSVNQNKHRVHVIPGLCYVNRNLIAIQKPQKSIYFAEIFYGFKMSLLFSECLNGETKESGFPPCLGLWC